MRWRDGPEMRMRGVVLTRDGPQIKMRSVVPTRDGQQIEIRSRQLTTPHPTQTPKQKTENYNLALDSVMIFGYLT